MSCSSPSRKGSSQQSVAIPGGNRDKTLTTGCDSCHLPIYMQLNYSALIDAFLRHSPRAVSPQAWMPSQGAVQAKLAAGGSGVQRAWLTIPKGDA
jgi:hypothetical protein